MKMVHKTAWNIVKLGLVVNAVLGLSVGMLGAFGLIEIHWTN